MYGWLWRNMPGGTGAKIAQSLVALLAALTLLFLVVFPWASHHVPFLQVTVEQPTTGASPTSTPTPTPTPS